MKKGPQFLKAVKFNFVLLNVAANLLNVAAK